MKKKVLIIEDNKDLQSIYRLYFEKNNCMVYLADNGLAWITKLLEVSPDVVMLDLMMPQMNGYEVLETIKKQSSINTPIAVCSNLSQESDIQKAYEHGADIFINKSLYDGSQVVTMVLWLLEKK